jgi:hypothetical protein
MLLKTHGTEDGGFSASRDVDENTQVAGGLWRY